MWKKLSYLAIGLCGLFWNKVTATVPVTTVPVDSTFTRKSGGPIIAKENPTITVSGSTSVVGKEIYQKGIKMETTLIILKPDCMEKGLAGEVIGRFCKEKFEIVGCKMMTLPENILKEHYAHIASLPFFPEILTFMRSQPVIVIALKGENIIGRVRDLLGPTDSTLAPKGTIRGDWGTDKMRNIAHASDSEENAQKELKRFFAPEELFL
ncbi:MAG: nucleoside-diphosphate kinase [Puniceicoccales bacterium]|jgi:nucleoside-diphosphate kinase|nr:nucleoside-diphosphate kinase [Puniceicoccales bacterium]